MQEKISETDMRQLVAAVAGPRGLVDSRERWLERAARLAGITYRQCKAVFYGEITDPYHRSVVKLKEAAARAGKREAAELAARFETIAGQLNAADSDFHSTDVAALIDAARALRGLDRSRADE